MKWKRATAIILLAPLVGAAGTVLANGSKVQVLTHQTGCQVLRVASLKGFIPVGSRSKLIDDVRASPIVDEKSRVAAAQLKTAC